MACHFWTYNNPYSQNSRIFLEDLAENYNITLPTSLTLNQLEKFRNYSIEVLAMTKAGDGPRSNTAFCKTLDDGKF